MGSGGQALLLVLVLVSVTTVRVQGYYRQQPIYLPRYNIRQQPYPFLGMGPWSSWGSCSQPCGGYQVQTRSCGYRCTGVVQQCRPCNVVTCGGGGQQTGQQSQWQGWSQWSACPVTCGGSQMSRTRGCMQQGNVFCQGSSMETRHCNTQPCPQPSTWSGWGSWGACSVSCGSGTTSRQRTCNVGSYNTQCQGESQQTHGCVAPQPVCPYAQWVGWGSWSPCTSNCGQGSQYRSRQCQSVGGGQCHGQSQESRPCSGTNCPISSWGGWSSWSACQVTCGGGTQSRTRTCDNQGQNPCGGQSVQTTQCAPTPCPLPSIWTSWGAWSPCSVTCGYGTSHRTRQCTGGGNCVGETVQSQQCNQGDCATWGGWGSWQSCSVSCGSGFQERNRYCQGGNTCQGSNSQMQNCNTGIACLSYGPWGSWGSCSATCGGGTQQRSRSCIGADNCFSLGPAVETRSCDTGVPCAYLSFLISYGGWTEWSACTVTCGWGWERRTRRCPGGGSSCRYLGKTFEDRKCKPGVCPSYGPWTAWDDCSATCDWGWQRRTRGCSPSGDTCKHLGKAFEDRKCQTRACAGSYGPWTTWDACSVTCDWGWQRRRRRCSSGGDACKALGRSVEDRKCMPGACPSFSQWSPWGTCSVTCDWGWERRTRRCIQGGDACRALGKSYEDRKCMRESCSALYGPWTTWDSCSVTCDWGWQRRTRRCSRGGDACRNLGESYEDQKCMPQKCASYGPWTTWDSCSVTCDWGWQRRTRQCNRGGDACAPLGESYEDRKCMPQKCHASYGSWSSWSACGVTCGSGWQRRTRSCSAGGNACDSLGPSYEDQQCNAGDCPTYGQWSQWDACSSTCGSGWQRRRRSCTTGGNACDSQGPSFEDQRCDAGACATYNAWSSWDACSVTCGGGWQRRSRSCSHGGDACGSLGPSYEDRRCDSGGCAYYHGWRGWRGWREGK